MASILVVERDPNVCTVLTDALESELSAFVQCTTSAREGAKAIESGSFDLAIIDAGLPDLFGIELARRAAHMNIPPLLTSGQPSHIEEIRSLDLALLTKPFRLSDLIFVSAQVIAQAQETLDRAEASFAEVDVSQEALQAEIAESRRLIAEDEALLVDCKLPSSRLPPAPTGSEPRHPVLAGAMFCGNTDYAGPALDRREYTVHVFASLSWLCNNSQTKTAPPDRGAGGKAGGPAT